MLDLALANIDMGAGLTLTVLQKKQRYSNSAVEKKSQESYKKIDAKM